MKASELLRASADLIREDGWLQGRRGNPVDGFCALGAMSWIGRIERTPAALVAAERYFVEVIGGEPRLSIMQQVAVWNDDKSRTKRQVLANFKKAARLAEKEGK